MCPEVRVTCTEVCPSHSKCFAFLQNLSNTYIIVQHVPVVLLVKYIHVHNGNVLFFQLKLQKLLQKLLLLKPQLMLLLHQVQLPSLAQLHHRVRESLPG